MSISNEKENEFLAQRFHRDIFQKRKMDVVDEILTCDFVQEILLFLPNLLAVKKG